MLVKLIRYVRGYVTCIARGKFTERLINILNRQGYTYWNIVPCKDGISFSVNVREYKRLRKSLYKTGIKTRIKKKIGLPFIIKKYKARKGIFIGAIIFLLITFTLSKFIWVTTVNGNNNVPTTKILNVLNDVGIRNGVYKENLNLKDIERKVVKQLPELRWISINLTGCKAEVEVKEKYKVPTKVLKNNQPANLKCRRDAVVVKSSVLKGTPMVKVGSAVVKGQMLVSGVVVNGESEENTETTTTLVHSVGEIIGRTHYERTYKIKKKSEFLCETDEMMKRKRCNLLWFSFPIDFNHIKYHTYKSTKRTYYGYTNDIVLPFSLTEEYIYKLEKKNISVKEYKKQLNKLAKLEEKFYFHNKNIEKCKYTYRQDKDYYYIDCDYQVTENLCVQSPIIVGN